MRIGTRRRLELLGRIVGASVLLGSAYGGLLNVAAYGAPRFGILIGAIHGFLLGSAIGFLEVFGTRSRPGRLVEQAPSVPDFGRLGVRGSRRPRAAGAI